MSKSQADIRKDHVIMFFTCPLPNFVYINGQERSRVTCCLLVWNCGTDFVPDSPVHVVHLQLVLSPEFSCPILPFCSLSFLVEVPDISALKKEKKKSVFLFLESCLQTGGPAAGSQTSLTPRSRTGVERPGDGALFYADHECELRIFESLLAGERDVL